MKIKVFTSTTKNAAAQLLTVGVCSAILFLFVALTYSQITLPRYTASYGQKDTQQVVNLIITVAATVIGILLSHCRRLTNEAETRSELRNERLTIPRLHVHFEAAGGSKAAMGLPAIRNKDVWYLVAFYLFAMIVFGFLHSVLSVIFVIEAVISDTGIPEPVPVPLSIDISNYYTSGAGMDPCSNKPSAPGCAYEYALQSYAAQLVTKEPYTIAGVTFEPPNGTLGLPYYAMRHFTDQVQSSLFEEERRTYCLPVMDPHIIKCHEEPFNQTRGQTINNNLVRYKALNVSEVNYSDNGTKATLVSTDDVLGVYKVVIHYPQPLSDFFHTRYRTDDQGEGTMTVIMDVDSVMNTVVTGSNNDDTSPHGYASLLYKMMYSEEPDIPDTPYDSYVFVAQCHLDSIMYRDNYLSSWRLVDFTLKNGVSRANVTDKRCPNARGDWTSGFADLIYALEEASTVLASTDGYSKLFNLNPQHGEGTSYFANMSRLDAVANQILQISQTGFTESNYEAAMHTIKNVTDNPVIMLNYPHLYVIRMSWTPTTYIGLVLSLLITLNAIILAGRWAKATYDFGLDAETWNLLRPVDLMAYSLAAFQDLIHDLNTAEHRKNAMRGETKTILHERPVKEGTQSLIQLLNATPKRTPASSPPSSPTSTLDGNFGSPQVGGHAAVDEAERGLAGGH